MPPGSSSSSIARSWMPSGKARDRGVCAGVGSWPISASARPTHSTPGNDAFVWADLRDYWCQRDYCVRGIIGVRRDYWCQRPFAESIPIRRAGGIIGVREGLLVSVLFFLANPSQFVNINIYIIYTNNTQTDHNFPASLVERAEQWPWSSLCPDGEKPPLDPGPAPRGAGWVETVNAPMTEAEGEAIRTSIRRNRPLGTEPWVRTTAEKLGLQSSLRAPGRPRGTTETKEI